MEITYHYPPELLNLLIDTIPSLCRSKKDVLLFFKGAGIGRTLLNDVTDRVATDRENITKYEIVRTVLARLNDKGEATLRERREVLKRVTEFDDFSTCWPNDQLKAKGLVAEIRRVINVKDSFTRIKQERDAERQRHMAQKQSEMQRSADKRAKFVAIKEDLFALFAESDSHKRGKKLEGVLNRLFDADGILIREAFTLKGASGEGIVEQVDGVIELQGAIYLVEMKWWDEALGTDAVSQHLVRVFSRGHARGIFISASGYTGPAIKTCREALQRTVVVLCELKELVMLLEREEDLKDFLSDKINAAVVDKNPMHEPFNEIDKP
jgi:hypothetical protein